MPVTWSDEKLILLYCPGRGSNSRPSAHRGFKHERGVPRPYSLGHGGDKWSPRQQRHLAFVSEFTTNVRHVPGVDNVVADALSRVSLEDNEPGVIAAMEGVMTSVINYAATCN